MQAAAMQAMPQMPQGQQMPQMTMISQAVEAPTADAPAAAKVAKSDGPRGPALDMSAGLDLALVKTKVMEIALRITQAGEGDIETDTPLMEAGLTSNSAILMRDELSA